MTSTVQQMLSWYRQRTYRDLRTDPTPPLPHEPKNLCRTQAEAEALQTILEAQHPLFYQNDRFGFHRTVAKLPCIDDCQWERPESYSGNIVPDYPRLMKRGLADICRELEERLPAVDDTGALFFGCLLTELNAVMTFCQRVKDAAADRGLSPLATALERVPARPPRTFYEALLFQKILIFALRCCPKYDHLTLGRFDQYMYPYYAADRAAGVPKEDLLETLELYFIDLNFDTDLYRGVQQGDNGQSMVLGGYDAEGQDQYNELSSLCMTASKELCLIDPKINLRVNRSTPIERYREATALTKQGLGFPQYSNDDVVVPGLIALGYAPEDARDYAVAACWEYIIPGKGADIPNFGAMNYPVLIGKMIRDHLPGSETFEQLMAHLDEVMEADCIRLRRSPLRFAAAPMLSLMIEGTLESGKMLNAGVAKYNNIGFHGAGLANAADALAAVKQCVYEDKTVDKETLLAALKANFEGYDRVRKLLQDAPKMGNNDDRVDGIACRLMDAFSTHMNGVAFDRGVCRAGTGSAQGYVEFAKDCPATADGRLAGQPYSSSFSPALDVPLQGPLSMIQSFTKFDLRKTVNGGPLTMEVHDTVFRNTESEEKVAMLVKLFIDRGGHQLQINAINRDRLLDARRHPENYPDLIVRVWGWSGYIVELSKPYQDHIIRRTEFTV